jgi:hypothetical protein
VAPDQQGNTHFSMESGMRTMNWIQDFSVHKRIISAIKRVEFVSDRMGGTCSTNEGEEEHVGYWWKSQRERSLGRPRVGCRDYIKIVRFEVFTAVTMKNCVFWVVTPCGSCKNRP